MHAHEFLAPQVLSLSNLKSKSGLAQSMDYTSQYGITFKSTVSLMSRSFPKPGPGLGESRLVKQQKVPTFQSISISAIKSEPLNPKLPITLDFLEEETPWTPL
jgi:hypothetical protein